MVDKDIPISELGIKDINFGLEKFADDPIEAPPLRRVSSSSHGKVMGGGGWSHGRQRLTDITAKVYKGIEANKIYKLYNVLPLISVFSVLSSNIFVD